MSAALIAPAEAAKLLDEIVYERVLGFVDLDALFRFEQELWLAFAECGVEDDKVPERSKEMIDRALRRIPDDPRRYMSFGLGEGDDCELCELAARAPHVAGPSQPADRASRAAQAKRHS